LPTKTNPNLNTILYTCKIARRQMSAVPRENVFAEKVIALEEAMELS
jgi:hypothetical protein